MAVAFTKKSSAPAEHLFKTTAIRHLGGEENNFIKSLRLEEKVARLAVSDEV